MSNGQIPAPRPALRKAPDGSVHPASVVLSSLAVTVPIEPVPPGRPTSPAPKDKKGGKKSKKSKGKRGEEPKGPDVVSLEVQLAKPVRKALRRRAAEYGWTAEEAAAQVLRVWADN